MTKRTDTRQVVCGGVPIGGGAPIAVQSMTNTFTEDVVTTAAQISELYKAGADIVRVAVPTQEAARAIAKIKARLEDSGIVVPIVADIHFDYRIAIEAIRNGADKIRINPGNIGDAERLKMVADAAGLAGIPMRIGVNSGSLESDLRELYDREPAAALVESALRNVSLVRRTGFDNIVISIKSSNVVTNAEAHRLLAESTDLPLHIGITEAGYGEAGLIKSAVGIGALLAMGIGDTLRVSLTGDPLREVAAAQDILHAVNLLPGQITLISCPTCGRCRVDLAALCNEVSEALKTIESERIQAARRSSRCKVFGNYNSSTPEDSKVSLDTYRRTSVINQAEIRENNAFRPITVALMGCAVNGPGEASQADFGIACGPDGGVFFEKGIKGETIPTDQIVQILILRMKFLS